MKKITLFFIILSFVTSFGQDLPPIIKYSTATYGGGNQNWMVSQDAAGYLYFANNEGLLEYNGTAWNLYPTPNETIMRSVKVIGNKIYCGFYMDFGYWTRKADGTLTYTSLTTKIRNKIIDDEQFWNIAQYDRWVMFQSLSQIFIYDTKTDSFTIISSDTGMNKVFTANNTILYQTFNSGLYEIENGQSKLLSNAPLFLNSKVVNIFGREDNYLIITQYSGIYELKNGQLTQWAIEADSELKNTSIYSCQLLSDGCFAMGTVSNGIFILTPQGRVKYHITQSKGLSNNTALSMFEDADKNLWLGLDNGINCINMQSAVHGYVDDSGFLGTVYSAVLYHGLIYVGTNQGLFCKPYNSSEEFKFVPGTKGQVWSLFAYDDTLFCGHDYGTFIINGMTSTQIYSGIGTWKFEAHPTQKNLVIQGNYLGLSVLEKTASGWKYRNNIEGFVNSTRFFAIRKNNEVYVSHEYKGIYRLDVNAAFTKALKVTAYKYPGKGRNVSLATFNGKVYYASKEGVFKLNDATKKFEKQD